MTLEEAEAYGKPVAVTSNGRTTVGVISKPFGRWSIRYDDNVTHVLGIGLSLPKVAMHAKVSCSQCGRSFGPADHGFSHCENHQGMIGTDD